MINKFVVVTTDKDHRGVFGGLLAERLDDNRVILKDAQMAVYWSESTQGVLGLASIGPQKGSRITPVVPSIELKAVTSITEATPEAQAKWREQPWD